MITDKRSPGQTKWGVTYTVPLKKYSGDYGIVARLKDSITEKSVMVIGGLSVEVTMSAEEVVTHPQYLEELLKSAPEGWDNRNMEAAVETQVIDGKSGPPKVVVTQYC